MERSDAVTLSCFMVSIIRQQVACRITKTQVVYRFSIVYSTKMTVSHKWLDYGDCVYDCSVYGSYICTTCIHVFYANLHTVHTACT